MPLLLVAGVFGGIWAWNSAEDQLQQQTFALLDCENINYRDLEFDWSYRSVTITGNLPAETTAAGLERVIVDGAQSSICQGRFDGRTGVLSATFERAVEDAALGPTTQSPSHFSTSSSA